MSETDRAPEIVVIEDDPDIAALVEGILSDARHSIDLRSELGSGAVELSVRLVITDLAAIRSYDPRAARDWITKVRARFPKAAVLVSTAHAAVAEGGAAAVGADAVLMKPFDVSQFSEIVESLLHR